MKNKKAEKTVKANSTELLPFGEYDKVIVSFSGGKDSLASLLVALDAGIPKEKIELFHQQIDGAPGSDPFMDWPVTEAYVRATAQAFGIKVRFQWKEGGFKGEMLRENARTQPTTFELSDGSLKTVGGKGGKETTRRMFPQVSPDLSVRWCSAYLKIDVFAAAINNDPELKDKKILVITGERRGEGGGRKYYPELERHRSTNQVRRVDQWRAVIDFSEAQVWDIIKKNRINPHPAYRLGWGRVSCMTCIFGDKNQWASVRDLAPLQFEVVAGYEKEFGKTIQREESVKDQADKGISFVTDKPKWLKDQAVSREFSPEDIFTAEGQEWELPAGAFKTCGGPQ